MVYLSPFLLPGQTCIKVTGEGKLEEWNKVAQKPESDALNKY